MSALVDAANKMNTESESIVPVNEKADGAAPETTGTPELTKEEKEAKLKEHFNVGKRSFLTNEFRKAVDSFALASEIAGEIFGDDAEESFDPFFYYGQSLLELAKLEDQIFSNAMSNMPEIAEDEEPEKEAAGEEQYGDPEKLSEEERADIKQKVEEALSGEPETKADEESEADKSSADVEVSASEEAGDEGTKTENAEDGTATEEEEGGAEEENDEGENNEDEDAEDDDDNNLVLAWEILEVARRICDKKLEQLPEESAEDTKLWSLRKADVLNVLGEHGIADNKFEQAQTDLKSALEIQTKFLEDSSRILAQTNHNLAKAYRHNDNFEEAATHFTEAQSILKKKVEQLEKELKSEALEAKADIEAELKDLIELIPELEVHIDDAKASAEQASKMREFAKEQLKTLSNVFKTLTPSEENGEIETNDITSMIRRTSKRPASTEPEDAAAKKTKAEGETSEEKTE